ADELDLSGVNSGADIESDLADRLRDGRRASHGPSGSVKDRQKAVARRVDLSPAEPAELLADDRVMAIQERPPGVVTEDTCPLGRPDDVGEQDRRQDSILLRRRSDAGEELLHFI